MSLSKYKKYSKTAIDNFIRKKPPSLEHRAESIVKLSFQRYLMYLLSLASPVLSYQPNCSVQLHNAQPMRQLITEPGKFSWERVGMALNTTIALGENKCPGLIGAKPISWPSFFHTDPISLTPLPQHFGHFVTSAWPVSMFMDFFNACFFSEPQL